MRRYRPLVEVLPGVWVDEMHGVWCVDNKTWLLLAHGERFWTPGDWVEDVIECWQNAHA